MDLEELTSTATSTLTTTAAAAATTTTLFEADVDRKLNDNFFLSDANVTFDVVSGRSTVGQITSSRYDDEIWSTASDDDVDDGGGATIPVIVIVGTLVTIAIIAIVIGNAFVVASVVVYREMRTLTNWMIVSLASADILVAVAVLPLSAYQVRLG